MKTLLKKNYHWLIALLVFLEMIMFGGIINSNSVFINPICKDLNVSRGDLALSTTPYTLVCFLGTSMIGFLFQRFGYKRCALVALSVTTLSLLLTASAKSLAVYAFSKILFGSAYGICFTAGSVLIVKQWFHKHQGLVLGAVSMSTGLGGSLLTDLFTVLIEKYDWRVAHIVAAILMALIGALYLLIKNRPEDIGLRPYGFGEFQQKDRKNSKELNGQDWEGYPMQEQLRHPTFYLMIICVLTSCVCLYQTSSFVVTHFQIMGFSNSDAANYQKALMYTLAITKLIGGALCDRFGSKPVGVFCILCGVVSQAILGLSADPLLCYVGVIFFGIALCMSSLMIPLLATPMFGYKASQSTNGVFLAMASLASIIASPLAGYSSDMLGSYQPAFRAASIGNIVVLAMYLLLFYLTKKEKQRFLAQKKI